MTTMATRRRHKKKADPTGVAVARAGQLSCDQLIRTAWDGDSMFEARCVLTVHSDEVKHFPGRWVERPALEVF